MPFQLFDNGNERTYLAQSGLTGANGPDARSQRPSAVQQRADAVPVWAKVRTNWWSTCSFSEAGVNYIKRFTFKPRQPTTWT